MSEPYAADKKRLLRLAREWSPLLGLDDYDIEYDWHDGPIPDTSTAAIMRTTANWCYKWATIGVNLPLVHCKTDNELTLYFLHECGHIICRVFPDHADDDANVSREEERFCTDLAQILDRVARRFAKKPSK